MRPRRPKEFKELPAELRREFLQREEREPEDVGPIRSQHVNWRNLFENMQQGDWFFVDYEAMSTKRLREKTVQYETMLRKVIVVEEDHLEQRSRVKMLRT